MLGAVRHEPTAAAATEAAREFHEWRGQSEGNGSLVRTAPVELAFLRDPQGVVEGPTAVSCRP